MTPTAHPLCNDVLRKPEGMTDEQCGDLPIRREDGYVWSFWKPEAEELLALNNGGSVALAIMGATHPPVSVQATHPHEDSSSRAIGESEYRNRMVALNGRMNALIALMKKAFGAWARHSPSDKDRLSLTDEFLDMLNANRSDGSLVKTVPDDAAEWERVALQYQAELNEIVKAINPEGTTMALTDEIAAMKREIARWEQIAAAKQKRIDDAIETLQSVTALHKVDLPELNPNPKEP
jgi:hypothetical protein